MQTMTSFGLIGMTFIYTLTFTSHCKSTHASCSFKTPSNGVASCLPGECFDAYFWKQSEMENQIATLQIEQNNDQV